MFNLKPDLSLLYDEIYKKVNTSLFKNIFIVSGLALGLKFLAFFKETIVASAFGLSETLDTFFIALIIPSFLKTVFIGGLKGLFIPNYVKELKDGNSASSFQTMILFSLSALAIVLTLLIWFVFRHFIEDLFTDHSTAFYALIIQQLKLILPCILIWALSGFLSSMLELDNKFFITSICEIFTPIITVFLVVFFSEQLGNQVLAAGLLIGTSLSFFSKLYFAIKYHLIHIGPVVINTNMRIMLAQYPPKIISSFLTGINPFVDQFFAAQLMVGSVAAINYGAKIPALISGILLSSMGSVLLPYFSKLIHQDREKAYMNLFLILKFIFISISVLVLLLILFSDVIVKLVFERGAFDASDTLLVAVIQKISLIYVPFYIGTIVIVRFLTSINENKFMALASTWNLFFNLILNVILVKSYGLYGIVWSTTIVYMVNFGIYLNHTQKCRKRMSTNF